MSDENSESTTSRRDLVASAGLGIGGIGAVFAYLKYVHEPPKPLEIEVTSGSEYVTGVSIPNNGRSVAFSEWDPDGLEIAVSDALDADTVLFHLEKGSEKLGWNIVEDPPGKGAIDYKIMTKSLPGDYTVTIYGGDGPIQEWDKSDDPSNRPPDAEASFTIKQPERSL